MRNVSPTFQATGAPLKRGYVAQALIDVGAVLFGLLFIGTRLASIALNIFALFLVLGI
ncbi:MULTISPECIES: hypothetical protein [unclassified Bradyrhizobium]|uniref:hypothetical protein n=1 Tax=unclassified Bradyrhizobium TaxID=2631580 RepID=UPI001BAB65ED|nr:MULTISPECIES: hypothetical protein [unclassified Bradyrhizobium]MBR1206594.1 hypothetical protein [Bradyrhizobium sp. AUGA SZCCT0124]MBR1315428.1 hypothetical protein [Bradyrhizobium sp. AUGA SZCCT0051]MBR1338510.1 hypothetical protein [Bradyrhizobium sp. AUGA SZCCT0105]MBR1356165.1 hypothetical protein [Bradyrhizobium sp. AUGA SZCCT0045]